MTSDSREPTAPIRQWAPATEITREERPFGPNGERGEGCACEGTLGPEERLRSGEEPQRDGVVLSKARVFQGKRTPRVRLHSRVQIDGDLL
jgi:hypothetical protein